MAQPTIIMKRGEELRIRQGHPWVFDNEIARVEGKPSPGGEVRVADSGGNLLGYGFYNPVSKIRARIFSKTSPRADGPFFSERFRDALEYRRRYFNVESESLRMVFGEADSVPGLVVDRFVDSSLRGTWLSAQFLSLGVDQRKSEIIAALAEVFQPDGIVERSEAPVRALEGLEPATGIVAGSVPETIIIEENGAKFEVDLAGGQKTGWFLDQRANRSAVARWARDRSVLDVFCNQGGFGILCGINGATAVRGVDGSREVLAAAAANAEINKIADRYEAVEANAFDYLRQIEKAGEHFDMVILDPPAFAKSRSAVESAARGYKEINVRGMRLLNKGGLLATCSCSFWFDAWRFDRMLAQAAEDCGKRFRVLYEGLQDLDHPIVSGYGESRYLKCRILELL
jgi:23S rRNA (cytosine1962-C5)-methyltransferase